MPRVDPKALQALLEDSGVSAKMQKKILGSNGQEAPAPAGQGSAEMPDFPAA